MTDTLRQMFRDSDMFNRDSYIRNKLEKFSKWAEAAECWAYIGRKADADACKLLAESCAKGDAYREVIKPINDRIEEIRMELEIHFSNPRKIVSLGNELEECHSKANEIYKGYYPRNISNEVA